MTSSLTSDPWIGRVVGDRQRYRLEKRLGVGGMGEVFLAIDTLLGQQVALKLLKDTLVASEQVKKRFEREVALCAALKSDHIVQVTDYGVTAEGYPFYTMECLIGKTLEQVLREQPRLPVERTINIVTQICQGLHLAHTGVTLWQDGATAKEHVKVVHRDLKPGNIFLVSSTLGELVKILDFGIAKIRSEASEPTTLLTSIFLGTFHYAAPEQLEGEKDIDARADIYSLGIILYEMLSGTNPFGLNSGISGVSWALAHTSKPPIPLRLQPGLEQISPKLEAVVMQCLQKSPNERFATVEELKDALLTAAAVESAITTIPESSKESVLLPQPILLPGKPVPEAITTEKSLPHPNSSQPKLVSRKSNFLLKGIGMAMAIGLAVTLYPLNRQQSKVGTDSANLQIKTLANQQLAQAKKLAATGKFVEALRLASMIPQDSPFYRIAQPLVAQWADSTIKQATAQFQAGKLEQAIALAQAIPITVPAYHNAQAAITQWRNDWQVAKTQFDDAQTALNAGQWDVAIYASTKIPNISYWQQKVKPIIHEAQLEIAEATAKIQVTQPSSPSPEKSPSDSPASTVKPQQHSEPVNKPATSVPVDSLTPAPLNQQVIATPTPSSSPQLVTKTAIHPTVVAPTIKTWEDEPVSNGGGEDSSSLPSNTPSPLPSNTPSPEGGSI